MKSMFLDWQLGRIAYASWSRHPLLRLLKGSEWRHVAFGIYWRTKDGR